MKLIVSHCNNDSIAVILINDRFIQLLFGQILYQYSICYLHVSKFVVAIVEVWVEDMFVWEQRLRIFKKIDAKSDSKLPLGCSFDTILFEKKIAEWISHLLCLVCLGFGSLKGLGFGFTIWIWVSGSEAWVKDLWFGSRAYFFQILFWLSCMVV